MRFLLTLMMLLGAALAAAADPAAVDRLMDRLAELGARARTHEREISEYNDGCRSGTAVRTDTNVSGMIDNATTPECRIRASRFATEERAIRDDLAAAKETARRAAIPPGTLRDAIKRNGLGDYTGAVPEPKFRGGALP